MATAPPDPFRSFTASFAFATVAALAFTVWDLRGEVVANPELLASALMVALLQWWARPQPVWGSTDCAWVVILAFKASSAGNYPGGSLLFGCLIARFLLTLSGRSWCELLHGWLPTLAAAQAIRYAHQAGVHPALAMLGSSVVWWTTASWWSGWVASRLPEPVARSWREGAAGQLPRNVALAAGGVALAALLGSHQLFAATLLVGPLLLIESFQLDRSKVVSREELGLVQSRLDAQLRRSEQLSGELQAVRAQLDLKIDERTALEELAEGLAGAPDSKGTAGVFLHTIPRLVPSTSVVFFLLERDVLEPRYFSGVDPARLEAGRLLQLHEPILRQAWETGQMQSRDNAPGGQLFPQDLWALCYPMPGLGLFYVGSARPWNKDHLALLAMIARQAHLALNSACRFDAQRAELGYHSKAHEVERARSHTMSLLLTGLSDLLGALDTTLALESMQDKLGELFPNNLAVLVLGDDLEILRASAPFQEPAAVAVARTVMEAGTTLHIDDLTRSRFSPLTAGHRCMLAAPIPGPGSPAGALIVSGPEAIEREAVQVLEVTAGLFGGIWQNARLRDQLVTAYQQLQDHQEAAIQSSKLAAVGQLAAGVAHELNNPLGAVLLSIESSLKMADRPKIVATLLEQALKGVARSREIVAKLLYYSRDAAIGKRRLELGMLIEDTVGLVRRQLELDKVRVTIQPASEQFWTLANENELYQVLSNLLFNARDAVLEGTYPAEITVTCGAVGKEVYFAVIDQGAGMDAAVLARATEPFYTTKPVGRGTGLGLSLSQQIVTTHQGRLDIESRPGQGTQVKVWLARAEADQDGS